jgi:phosphatidylserine/phosphatidylglycerophosphate/cardiolipin synthase-like enzyme
MNSKKSLLFLLSFYVFSVHGFCRVFFRPRDKIKDALLQLIKEERKSIDVAMYMFTDKVIAQELIDAYVRGVRGRAVLDQISMGERYGKGVFLRSNGVTVIEHIAPNPKAFSLPIMHHKFFLFGQNSATGLPLVWTGSYNCTAAASTMHDENALLTDDAAAISEYRQCFASLLARLSPDRSFSEDDDEKKDWNGQGVA